MTLNEVTRQLFSLSVGGYFNHEKFTFVQLHNYISKMTHGGKPVSVIMEIALSDGWWYFTVSNLPQFGRGFYDYNIPDSRRKEAHIKSKLFSSQNSPVFAP